MNAAHRRERFMKARAPVAVAMRVVAASVAMQARAAGVEPSVRRSVFMRRGALGLAAPFALDVADTLFGTVGDKELH